MANQDNENSKAHDSEHALVETNSAASSGQAMAMANPFGGMGASQGTDVLKGGMDKSWLYNSLRRRWLLALSMSLFMGTVTAVGLYWVLPKSQKALAQYQVASDPMTVLDKSSSLQTRDYEILQSTQIAYIRSPYVLTAVFRDSRVSQLPMFRDIDNRIDWLRGKLMVSFPNEGELLTIAMSGDYPKEDLKLVVEAVSKAYYDEVVFRSRQERQRPLQILKESYGKIDEQIRSKMFKYQSLAKDSGTSEAYKDGIDPSTRLLLTEVSQLQALKSELTSRLSQKDMEFQVIRLQLTDPEYLNQKVEEAVSQDPTIAQMQNEVLGIEFQIRQLQSTVKRGTSSGVRRLVRQKEGYQQQINQTRQQLRAQIAGQQANESDPLLKAANTQYQVERATIANNLGTVNDRIVAIQEELLDKAVNDTDLIIRRSEIEQLKIIQQQMANKIQNLEVEGNAPDRIQGIGAEPNSPAPAETSEDFNRTTKLAVGAAGGLGLFLLTGFCIAYIEFTNRKLNGPEQMDEGLGIRVVGTLPSLAGRKQLHPKHPIVAQLNESIDSIRTTLMHESTRKRRQLVMVTSAETGEGRTTVSSQLAASLARAGRRTLLIDGDLREPALHTLFNLPLEDGFSEVLRKETEVSEVIRPTPAAGLWLMTAGYCDTDAVKALGQDNIKQIFEKLRSQYDFIIIDAAPVMGLSDSLMVGQHCDGAIFSVLRDQSCVTKIHQGAEALKSVGVKLIGSVVNGVVAKADKRVTHLQQVSPKSEQQQLETAET